MGDVLRDPLTEGRHIPLPVVVSWRPIKVEVCLTVLAPEVAGHGFPLVRHT